MSTTLESFIERVRAGQPVEFEETLDIISRFYDYTPTRFLNGLGKDALVNEPGQNEGSCKIFSLARRQGLAVHETLALFGRYYRNDVLAHPDGSDHKNIRNFMRHGWRGIHFETEALKRRDA
jgi:hypothetical protein